MSKNVTDQLATVCNAYNFIPETWAQLWTAWCTEIERRWREDGRVVPYISGRLPEDWL